MPIELGQVEALFRYPVKSMAAVRLDEADLGWHGLEGDRRFALRLTQSRSDFPWLNASKLADLVRFTPVGDDVGDRAARPTHVRTPDGETLPVFGDQLARAVESRYGAPVQMMELKHGMFDEASVSVISGETIRAIGEVAGTPLDVRRFRPNVLLRLLRPEAFQEDQWVGGVLSFGGAGQGPSVSLTLRDVRCSMVNLDPDSARSDPEVLKAVVRMNQNNAGVYGVCVSPGRVAVGQAVWLHGRDELGAG